MLEVLDKFGFIYLDGLGAHAWGLAINREKEIIVMLYGGTVQVYVCLGRKTELIGTPVDAVSMERIIEGIRSGALKRVNRGDYGRSNMVG